jgi:hypothetical protein
MRTKCLVKVYAGRPLIFSSRQEDHGRAVGIDRFQIRLPRLSDCLESDAQGQLTNPCSILSTADLAKGRALVILVWRPQAVLVEGVK